MATCDLWFYTIKILELI